MHTPLLPAQQDLTILVEQDQLQGQEMKRHMMKLRPKLDQRALGRCPPMLLPSRLADSRPKLRIELNYAFSSIYRGPPGFGPTFSSLAWGAAVSTSATKLGAVVMATLEILLDCRCCDRLEPPHSRSGACASVGPTTCTTKVASWHSLATAVCSILFISLRISGHWLQPAKHTLHLSLDTGCNPLCYVVSSIP